MCKKILGLLLITAILLTLGCTGKDQGQPTVTPEPSQPAISPAPSDTNATANNESMPELDLPLPPDMSDI